MNRQTKSLYKKNLSLKFNRGVDFAHMGQTRHQHPEFTIVEFDSSKGNAVNSAFNADKKKTGNKRNSAWRGCPSARREN